MKKHIPVTIVSGFLGSGKTTLINRILKHAKGIRFALIINEFGEIGLDAQLIKGTQDFVKMANGCLCCVLSEDLIETLKKLKGRNDYDAVVLETTGVADPLPVAWPFLRPEFDEKFRFAGIATVADALNLDIMLTKAAEARLQIERADFIYLSKMDLCPPPAIAKIMQNVAYLNPNARLIPSTDPDWLDLLFDHSAITNPRESNEALPHAHTSHFLSLGVPLKRKRIVLEKMESFFESLPHGVFRAKSVFVTTENKTIVMHAVCGRVDFYEEPQLSGGHAAVFIGKDFDVEGLKRNFEKTIS